MHSVFDIRFSIAEAVADRINVRTGADDRGGASAPGHRRRPSVDLAAWNELVQGRYLFHQATPEGVVSAKQRFEAALERDPDFALAHDALAEFYAYLGYFGFLRPIDAFSIGISHALAAVEGDPLLGEAREVLAALQRSEQHSLPTNVGQIHLGLGEIDAAFECFDQAVEERDQNMMPILSYAHFDPIRGDPRFEALLRKMKLA